MPFEINGLPEFFYERAGNAPSEHRRVRSNLNDEIDASHDAWRDGVRN